MELVFHFATNKELLVSAQEDDRSLALKTGLEHPYLSYQLLAFSARHLAHLRSDRCQSYLHQAVSLQTRAISLFNATRAEVDRSNCIAVLLFSSILGHHLLTDTLAKRDHGGLDGFMTQYVQCVEMHKGIYTIATSAWPLLMDTELQPILSSSSDFNNRPLQGTQCRQLAELIDAAEGLHEAKDACRLAVKYLQIGFDAVLAEENFQMIFSWIVLVPSEFTRLLALKQPEVLVVLGYYALLLHHGRSLWQVDNAGAYLLGLIMDYLGPEWEHWLDYPQTVIGNTEAYSKSLKGREFG